MTETFVILGAGTAGLLSAIMIREKYPSCSIKIVKSNELGIIGVGEGSTEHFKMFLDFTGISHIDVIYNTKATIKIGILFDDWNLGTRYVHSVGPESEMSGIWRPEIYNHLMLSGEELSTSPSFKQIYYKNNVILDNHLTPSNQYHFDTFALNSYFVKVCEQRNIEFIETKIVDVKLNEDGYVTELISENGYSIPGDFFVDCSGFRRVISSKVGVEWKDYSEYLPMNHAIAFPTEHDSDNYEPYTKSTALKNGWVWKIPTQERYGNGYVFCDEFINSEEALKEVSQHLGKNIEKAARDIKFKAGRIDKFWHKNVLSIGLSGSFVEPLEAQSIGFTILQMFEFLRCFDYWEETKKTELYNKSLDDCFENIVDYIQLHYITKRTDSDFWKSKCYKLTDFNKEELPVLMKSVFDYFHLNKSLKMFSISNFYQVMAGLDLFDTDSISMQLQTNRKEYNNIWYEKAQKCFSNERNIMQHKKFIELVNFNYLNKAQK